MEMVTATLLCGMPSSSHSFLLLLEEAVSLMGRNEESQQRPHQTTILLRQFPLLPPIGSTVKVLEQAAFSHAWLRDKGSKEMCESVPVLCPQEMLSLASLSGELTAAGASRVQQLFTLAWCSVSRFALL